MVVGLAVAVVVASTVVVVGLSVMLVVASVIVVVRYYFLMLRVTVLTKKQTLKIKNRKKSHFSDSSAPKTKRNYSNMKKENVPITPASSPFSAAVTLMYIVTSSIKY